MNYYEELGVSPSASTGEIHQAYKALARLVHPDQCADEKLRGLAEIQMKRLNQMLAVLSDPEQRRRYDAGLEAGGGDAWDGYEEEAEPAWRRLLRQGRTAWPWLATAVVGTAGVTYYFAGGGEPYRPAPVEQAVVEEKREAAAPRVEEPAARRARREGGAARPSPLTAVREWQRQPEETRTERVAAEPAGAAVAETRAEAERPRAEAAQPAMERAAASGAVARREPARRFAGNWFYVRAMTQPKTSGLYPPEYIELRLAEEGGVLKGRYRARYRVTDQAISPVVSFQFEGPGQAPAARLPWREPGGAAGDIQLKLVSESTLEVNWTAHHLSDDVGLTSGTAMLVRQQER